MPEWQSCPGAKADPTRIRVVDIHESSVDPLARAVRHRLKRKHGIAQGIPVLLSTEKPLSKLVDVPAGGANPADYQVRNHLFTLAVSNSGADKNPHACSLAQIVLSLEGGSNKLQWYHCQA